MLSVMSLIFTVIGIMQVSFLSKLKDKRFYEYMIVSGLDRARFWAGVAAVLTIETIAMCLILLIIIGSL